jgi:7-cyano-7-deazaguanine synthase
MLSFSGGLDSTVLLAKLLSEQAEVIPVNFSYGSKHNYTERVAALRIAECYGLELIQIELDFINRLFKSALLTSGDAIPDGHYNDVSMKQTVVPFRNGIMLSILAGLAESMDCQEIYIAAHSGDHHIYPDCRPDFMQSMGCAILRGTYKMIMMLCPFENMTKSDIVFLGDTLDAPMHLSWTCYKGLDCHCGTCGSCVERKEAFSKASITDPTDYL